MVPVARDDDKKPMPPLILVKSEGGVLYGTTDLATVIERVREHDPDLILYVVDHRQHGHFEQVFRAAQKAGLSGKAASGTCRLWHHERAGRQAVQDPRRRRDEAVRPDRHGHGGSRKAPGGAGHRRRLFRRRARRDRAQGRHRHHQIRRSLQPPHHRLYFRPGALFEIRRQDRALSAICGGAHPIDPAQGRGAGHGCRRTAPSIRRKNAR